MAARNLTPDEIQHIYQLADQGHSGRAIARQTGWAASAVNRQIRRRADPIHGRPINQSEMAIDQIPDITELVELANTIGTGAAGQHYGCSGQTVRRRLHRNGYKVDQKLPLVNGNKQYVLKPGEEQVREAENHLWRRIEDFYKRMGPPFIPQDTPACADQDPRLFDGDNTDDNDYAKAVCARCPVRLECANYALDNKLTVGVWGGMTPKERHHIIEQLGNAA